MKKLSKAAMNRLLRSEFFHNVDDIVKAWDYYLLVIEQKRRNRLEYDDEKKCIDEMMHKWSVAKLALEFITGNIYDFSRDGNGNYSVVNEGDYSDRIISGSNLNCEIPALPEKDKLVTKV